MKSLCRFAAGERTGLKSSVWTVVVKKNDIYLFTKLFGGDFKLSLHESGDAQWSYTSEYVSRQNEMKNQDRHLMKWKYSRPENDLALNIFRIQIPHSELRDSSKYSSTKKVKWTSGITLGTYQFDFCITKPSENNPCEGRSDLPHQVLESLQLADKRWLVIFIQATGLAPVDLDNAKNSVIFEMKEKGINMEGAGWITLFGKGDDGVPLIMEFHYENSLNIESTK